MEYETAGDPMKDLKWTRRTTKKISEELAAAGIMVSKTTVGRILKELDFSLKSNVKKLSNGGKHISAEQQLQRDRQFKLIKRIRRLYEDNGCPVISVDTKKKELIGNFKNAGTRLKRGPDLTNDHDFQSYALGQAALYGVYETARNKGYVGIGKFLRQGKTFMSSDTPAFAVDCIANWWQDTGRFAYKGAKKLLILADAGGSNGCQPHMWKINLQKMLCDRYDIQVNVLHYPSGASKWNPVERRLFCPISKNWQGTPLKDYETVLKYTLTTTTKTGLSVQAKMMTDTYPKGVNATSVELGSLRIRKLKMNPRWGYRLHRAPEDAA